MDPSFVPEAKSFSLAFVRHQPAKGHLRNNPRPAVIQARINPALSHTDDFVVLEPSKPVPNVTECFSASFMTKCASASPVMPQIANTVPLRANGLLSADFLDRCGSAGGDPMTTPNPELSTLPGGPVLPLQKEQSPPIRCPSDIVVVSSPSPVRFKTIRSAWHVVFLIISMLWALATRAHDMQYFVRSVQAFDYHALCSHPLSSWDTLHLLCPTPVIDNYARFDRGAQFSEALSSPSADIHLINGLRYVMRLSEVGPHPPRVPLQYSPRNLTAKQCWPLNASSGRYGLSLPRPIYVTNVTMGHFLDSTELKESAPRDVTVWALVDLSRLSIVAQKILGSAWLPSHSALREDLAPQLKPGQDLIPLARMRYDIHSEHVTQGTVPQPAYIWNKMKVSGVVFEIHDNWGADQTCLYGVEVYGYTF